MSLDSELSLPSKLLACELDEMSRDSSYFVKKMDEGKLEWSLLPWEEIEELVRVLEFGAKKYSPNSWQGVPDGERRYTNAMLRHVVDFVRGIEYDQETQLPHLAHACVNALFLLYLRKRSR